VPLDDRWAELDASIQWIHEYFDLTESAAARANVAYPNIPGRLEWTLWLPATILDAWQFMSDNERGIAVLVACYYKSGGDNAK
jgi:hypothetical protein